MEVGIKVFMDGEECKLEDLPNEYLAGLRKKCEDIMLSNDRLDKVWKRMADTINENKK